MVEQGCLLSSCAGNGTGGSNPPLSARIFPTPPTQDDTEVLLGTAEDGCTIRATHAARDRRLREVGAGENGHLERARVDRAGRKPVIGGAPLGFQEGENILSPPHTIS